jgi:hypothetical protein
MLGLLTAFLLYGSSASASFVGVWRYDVESAQDPGHDAFPSRESYLRRKLFLYITCQLLLGLFLLAMGLILLSVLGVPV